MIRGSAMSCGTSCRERILDAAERIVLRRGAVHMTMDAIAAQAGVSKGGLIYHFPSQHALLRALLQRFVERVNERRLRILRRLPPKPTRSLRAYLLAWLGMGRREQRSAAALLATSTREPELVAAVRQRHQKVWAELLAGIPQPERAMILALAVEGMWMSELLGVSPLTVRQRTRLRAALLRLAEEWPLAGRRPTHRRRKAST